MKLNSAQDYVLNQLEISPVHRRIQVCGDYTWRVSDL